MKKSLILLLLFAFALAGCSPAAPEEAAEMTSSEETQAEEAQIESDEVIEPDADSAEQADGGNMDEPNEGDDEMEQPEDEADEPADEADEPAMEDSAETEAYPVAEEAAVIADEAYPVDSAEGALVFAVDPAASRVDWYGFKPTGGDHNGSLQVAEGTFDVAGDVLQGATLVLDMTSISNNDLSGGMKDRLEGHLMSEDFFSVEEFPTATLVIKSAESTAPNVYDVVADLTMKGITNEISFPAQASIDGNSLSGNAEITIDRSLWDVRFGSGSFFDNLGDDLISNDIKLTVQIAANS